MSPGPGPRERATPFTLVTSLRGPGRGWLPLIFWLATHLPLPRWTLLRLRLIHYARWTILSEPRPRLLFESDFNGTPDGYVEAFSYVFPRGMRAIWGSSEGFPGPLPVASLREWIDERAIPASHHYSAYPAASTKEVLAALEVKRRLRDFGERTARAGPERFAAEYERLLHDLQREL